MARIVSSLPDADGFALAGGAALVVMQVVDRSTRDLDYFGPSPDDVNQLVDPVERALAASGMTVERRRVSHGFARLSVTDGRSSTELDLAADARIRPAEVGPLGPILSLEELAADKLLALFDRAQARDFVDVDALVERFGLARLCQLAAEKDRGFSPARLLEALGAFGRFTADELEMDNTGRQRLAESIERWRDTLTELSRPEPRHDGPDPGLSL